MAGFAKAPNSCELTKTLNRGWQVQVKQEGTESTEYRFVPGLQSVNVAVTKNTTDATDLNSDGWASEVGTSRSLDIQTVIQYVERGGLALLDPVQEMLRLRGESTGADERIDVRVWRDDVDQGWEGTFTVNFTENGGGGDELRTANANFKSLCAPTRIHSVEEGEEKKDSVPLSAGEFGVLLSGPITGGL